MPIVDLSTLPTAGEELGELPIQNEWPIARQTSFPNTQGRQAAGVLYEYSLAKIFRGSLH